MLEGTCHAWCMSRDTADTAGATIHQYGGISWLDTCDWWHIACMRRLIDATDSKGAHQAVLNAPLTRLHILAKRVSVGLAGSMQICVCAVVLGALSEAREMSSHNAAAADDRPVSRDRADYLQSKKVLCAVHCDRLSNLLALMTEVGQDPMPCLQLPRRLPMTVAALPSRLV